jgi:hypothetical protein
MNDITLEQVVEALEDEDLKSALASLKLPEDMTINEFFVKLLDAASIAAAQANESLESGKKILGYPPATNGAIARAGSGQLFFPRSQSVTSRVVVSLDGATPVIGA